VNSGKDVIEMADRNAPLDCVVAGGGPAGVVAGLLLARAGLRVTVLEKHLDFLRDFRGDTVHASTLALLEHLGLGPAFRRLPHRDAGRLAMELDDGAFTLADFAHLPGGFRHISLVPQWDLLDLLATEAARWPGFTLRQGWEVTGLLFGEASGSGGTGDGDGRVEGVVARDTDGVTHEVRATLTIGADGRGSRVREAAGLPVRSFGTPIDVLWFRLPLADGDPEDVTIRVSAGAMAVLIRRETHWQCGLLVPKGQSAQLLRDDCAPLGACLARLEPWLAERAGALRAADAHLLDVRLDRLRRWSRPGLLCIGDAAHAMSPVAGVGINLAVQDAVATVNRVAAPLRAGRDVDGLLAGVQRRRLPPTVVTQTLQRQAHARLLGPVTSARAGTAAPVPGVLRVVGRTPWLQRRLGRLVAIGLRPELPTSPVVAPAS
jgi:2-polyprenyl-6-methoxyphenol hydroxylase-like FAD-dependent oxidoreductase